jgi:hypothetical protein
MLILLKLTCFTLWLAIMLKMILTEQSEIEGRYPVTLQLVDPEQAEHEIKSALNKLTPRMQLSLEIYCLSPYWPELLFIASCLQRNNPSIIIIAKSAETSAI